MNKKTTNGFYYNLSGGINLAKTKVGLGADAQKLYWDDSFNVELLKNQGVKSQKGNLLLLKTPGDEKIVGIREYPKNTDSFVFVCKSGKIYYYDSNLRRLVLKCTLEQKVYAVGFAQYLDGLVICTDNNEGVYFKLGAEEEFRLLELKDAEGKAVMSFTVAVYSSRLWIATGSTLYFSALGRFNDWETPDDAGYISKFHSSTSPIVSLCEYNGCLAVYKSDGVYLLNGNNPAEFTIVRFADIGALSHGGVVTENNKQYFCNSSGIFALEQTGELNQIALSDNIAYNIQPYFDKFDSIRALQTLAVPYKIKNQIWFFIPFLGCDTLKTVWIYDYYCKAWFKRVIPYEISTAAAVNGKVVTGSGCGEVFLEDMGNTFSSKPIEFKFSTPFFHLGLPTTRKIVENLNFIFDDEHDNAFKFSVSKDYMSHDRTDVEIFDSVQPNTLVFVGDGRVDNFDSNWSDFCWAETVEEAYRTEVFDSNFSVQLHIENEKIGDRFGIIGIEFKEVLIDEE